ncbi:MAG: peptidylprolyl isomerase [Bacteriovoracaceae bacterium]|nr:peptidylprolyl isomerase [Bacteriovoracaceae bacterium]
MAKRVIGFHYKLFDSKGQLLENSEQQGPLYFLEGHGQIIPGLESAVIGMNIGDTKKIDVKSKDAYGEIRADLVIEVSEDQFPKGKQLKIGDQFQVDQNHNSPVFIVKNLTNGKVTLDGNHPMAGKDLTFDVKISAIRPATAEEIAHGHAHGEDPAHFHHD